MVFRDKVTRMQRETMNEANNMVMSIQVNSNPRWIDVKPALDVIQRMKKNLILHSGPPITWKYMNSAQKSRIAEAAVYEGLAPDIDEARTLLGKNKIKTDSCHNHSTVGSFTGITSASMPVIVIYNEPFGNLAFIAVSADLSQSLLTTMFCYPDFPSGNQD